MQINPVLVDEKPVQESTLQSTPPNQCLGMEYMAPLTSSLHSKRHRWLLAGQPGKGKGAP